MKELTAELRIGTEDPSDGQEVVPSLCVFVLGVDRGTLIKPQTWTRR